MWQDVKMLNAISSALIALVLLALVASGLWWVAQRPMFTLHTIRIESAGELPLENLFAVLVPASVEFAFVPVAPLPRNVVRGVRRAGSEIKEKWLFGIGRFLIGDVGNSLIGQ